METELLKMINGIEDVGIRSLYKAMVEDKSINTVTSICQILEIMHEMKDENPFHNRCDVKIEKEIEVINHAQKDNK